MAEVAPFLAYLLFPSNRPDYEPRSAHGRAVNETIDSLQQ